MSDNPFAKLASLKQDLIKQGVKNPPTEQPYKKQSKKEHTSSSKIETSVAPERDIPTKQPSTDEHNFYLPYDFLEIQPSPMSYSYKKRGNLTGTLTVTLETVTPVIAIQQYVGQTPTASTIPASSIRGMVRNVAEMIWQEGLTVIEQNKLTYEEKNVIPASFYSDNLSVGKHRLASHLFGFALTKKGARGDDAPSMVSALKFTDASAITPAKATDVKLKAFSLATPNGLMNTKQPKKGLNPAYLNVKKDKIAGRKLYLAGRIDKLRTLCYAQRVPAELKEFVSESRHSNTKDEAVRLISPKSVYQFMVRFDRLTEAELAALIRVLELTGEATHALGHGKPLGFGRVKLNVTKIQVQKKEQFFNLSQPTTNTSYDKESLLLNEQNPHEQNFKLFEVYATIANFDNKKMYAPKDNIKPDGSRIVKQYSKHK